MTNRLVHHLVYTSLSASAPVACEPTFELAEARAREHPNGHAVLFISGAREIWDGEEGVGQSCGFKNFACPICSRPARQFVSVAERRRYERGTGVVSGTQLPPGAYRGTIARD